MSNSNRQLLQLIEEIEDESAFTLAKLVSLYGFTLSESRLFSLMYLESNPMTLDEMSKSLGMSKTSMSTGVRSLLDSQMVEKTWRKGTRKDLYIVEDDLYKTFSNAFIKQWLSVIANNTKTFIKLSKRLNNLSKETENPEVKNSILKYSKKIDDVINFYKWLEEIYKDIQDKIENSSEEKKDIYE